MQYYVVGFLFDPSREYVVLIRKERPDWQKGLLNGVGGKMLEEESDEETMAREFAEETGCTQPIDWQPFATLKGESFYVSCWKAFADVEVKTTTDEEVGWHKISFLIPNKSSDLGLKRTIDNLEWLIPLALDDEINCAVIEYPN